jgi:sulfonate transport system permease protein
MSTMDTTSTVTSAATVSSAPARSVRTGREAAVPVARAQRRRFRPPAWALRSLSPLALLLVWQVGSGAGLITERVLPAPSLIVAAARETWRDGSLVDALQISAQRVAIGFALGATVGLVLGVAVGLSRLLDHVVDPPLQMIRTIPFLGLIPLFILWFGIGETPKIAMVALGVSFPLYLNASAAIRHVYPKLVETAQVLRFSPWQRISVVVAPSALPQILVGLRQSLGIAWLSLIVAEQINADAGLGYLINNANQSLRTDIVVFGLILYALLGLTTDGVVRLLEKRALRWRPAVAR